MTKRELYESKIRALKQWMFLLMNYPEDDLGLPRNQSRRDAINEALDEMNHYRELIKSLDNEEA